MKKRGFTLIELLVVIAIVAVLASILFPVWSSSRRSPESGSSSGHLHAIALGELIYQSDYDTAFLLSATDVCNDACPSSNLNNCAANLPAPTANWPLILEPYLGTLAVYVDPSTGDPEGTFTPGSSNYKAQNWNLTAQFSYNYQFLSPVSFQGTTNGSGAVNCSNSTVTGLGRTLSQAVDPSNTVMFTTAQNFGAQWSSALAYLTPDSIFDNAPGTNFALLPSLDRFVFVGNYCFGSSFPHNVAGPVALGYCGWSAADPIGPLTGDTRTLSPYPFANVAWADGHVSTATASELATGTDFATATAASNPDPTYGFATGAIVQGLASSGRGNSQGATNALGLAAPTGYLWSLDGTLSDIN